MRHVEISSSKGRLLVPINKIESIRLRTVTAEDSEIVLQVGSLSHIATFSNADAQRLFDTVEEEISKL